MSISIQFGRKASNFFTHKLYLEQDLTNGNNLNVSFGIGESQDNEIIPSGSTNLFLRILEFASFDGNIINFNIDETILKQKRILTHSSENKRILSSSQDYTNNMTLIHYQLYCGDEMFLDRLHIYRDYLDDLVSRNSWIRPGEFNSYIPLDFIGCQTNSFQSSLTGCLWGGVHGCFVCDYDFFLYDFKCFTCQQDLSVTVYNHNQYLEQCTLQTVKSVDTKDTDSLDLSSDLDYDLYFLSKTTLGSQKYFEDLILKQDIPFVTNNVTQEYPSGLSNVKSSAITFVIDFSSTILNSSDFPLDVQILQTKVFMNSNLKVTVISKNIIIERNEYPYILFNASNS